MKSLGFQIMKDGSINGKVVALIETALVCLFYFVLAPLFKPFHDAAVDFGSRINEFFAISIGVFFLQKISKPGIKAIAGALTNKLNNKSPEGDV